MRITYRPAAIRDIQNAADYIEKVLKNPGAARRLKSDLLHGISALKEMPFMGAALSSKVEDADPRTRFLVIRRQMVFYEVTADAIEIIRILDGRTDYIVQLVGQSASEEDGQR